MKQIRTIVKRLDAAESFDAVVNAALKDGWRLIKRDVLIPRSQASHTIFHTMIYAELEREEIITEAKRLCTNCAHFTKGAAEEPCVDCVDHSGWEPTE